MALGIAGAGLATAVWATTADPLDDPEAMSRTIKEQRIRGGVRVAETSTLEHQIPKLTGEQMLDLANRYEHEIRNAIAHTEIIRMSAYRSHDIIRMSCIDDKLLQMRSVIRIADPWFAIIKTVKDHELKERSQFTIVQQAVDRVRILVKEMEDCLGEAPGGGRPDEESASGFPEDPTQPQQPGLVVDRPPEASSYQ